MRRRRTLFVAVFLMAAGVTMSAQGIDLIVMVDVSASMDPYFGALVDYFVDDLMRNMLQTGDTFHFLSFAGLPEVEMSAKIEDGRSRTTILNKISVLAPIGLYTDLVSAVEFLHTYTATLPPERTKQLVLITDGVHDPPPNSVNATNYDEALRRLLEGARSISKEGWFVHIFSLPLLTTLPGSDTRPGDPVTPRLPADSMLGPLARELGVDPSPYETRKENGETIQPEAGGFGQVTYAGDLGAISRRFKVPLEIANSAQTALRLDINSVWVDDQNWLRSTIPVRIPAGSRRKIYLPLALAEGIAPGEHEIRIRLETSGVGRLFPLEGELQFSFAGGAVQQPSDAESVSRVRVRTRWVAPSWDRLGTVLTTIPWRIVLPLLLLLLALLLIARVGWRFRPTRTTYLGRAPRGRGRAPTAAAPIEMLVSLQNRQVGFRNIHSIERGKRKSIGGGRSSFLVFVVKFPRRIAEVRFDGESYTFRVIKSQHLPTVPSSVEHCLDRDIPAVSAKGFPIVIRFVRYTSPLDRINQLLHSVYHEGVASAYDHPVGLPTVNVGHRFL